MIRIHPQDVVVFLIALGPKIDLPGKAKGSIFLSNLIAMLSNWRHSGLLVFCGQRIFPQDETAIETLARYIIRVSFSQERMQYLPGLSKVVYRAKDGIEEKVFGVLE